MIDLTGKVALISGAARGQGAAEAELFVDLGARVAVADIAEEEGRELAERLGDAATFVRLDVTRGESWSAAVAATVEHHHGLDVLVNNAGIAQAGPIAELDEDEYLHTVRVNQLGVALGLRYGSEPMKAVGAGSIVNISSTAGNRGVVGSIAYSATKWAVRGMTKTAAVELGPFGIRVNSVHPGVIDTAMVGWDNFDDAGRASIIGDLPIPRVGTPDDVAATVAFLASDLSSYSTGGEYMVDGGSLAGRSMFTDVAGDE